MSHTPEGSFLVQFRRDREERHRLEQLRRRAEELASEAPAAVAERVQRDLAARVATLEEAERQHLRTFVQRLKDGKEELIRAEHELEELDLRRRIGEIDDVEMQIRRESLGLRVREQKRTLEKDMEEYRALRALVEAADVPADVPAGPKHDGTVVFDSFRLTRSPEAPAPAAPAASPQPAPAPAPALPPLTVDEAGLESVVLDHDFVARSPEAAMDDLDDLSQLDVLSKSLERMAAARGASPGELHPVPMPSSPPVQVPMMAEGPPSSPSLPDDVGEEATVLQRPPQESQTLMVAQAVLILKGHDGGERATFVLKLGVSTLGRGLDNEVVLDDRAVSRKHATVAFEADGTFRITDLGSENGTYVNGARITSAALQDGDEIHMGKSTLVFSAGK